MSPESHVANIQDLVLGRALGDVERRCFIHVQGKGSAQKPETHLSIHGSSANPSSATSYQRIPRHGDNASEAPNLYVSIDIGRGAVTSNDASSVTPHAANASIPRAADRTLDDIIAAFRIRTIHFLTIDEEAAELQALERIDLSMNRPWVITIEPKTPILSTELRQKCERLITQNAYKLAYCDGLNLFYLAEEFELIRDAFSWPPNVFSHQWRHASVDLEQELGDCKEQLEGQRKKNDEMATHLYEANQELMAIRASTSWRATAPLRVSKRFIAGKKIDDPSRNAVWKERVNRLAVRTLAQVLYMLRKRPRLLGTVKTMLMRSAPGEKERLLRIASSEGIKTTSEPRHYPSTDKPEATAGKAVGPANAPEYLAGDAQRIYRALNERVIALKRKNMNDADHC